MAIFRTAVNSINWLDMGTDGEGHNYRQLAYEPDTAANRGVRLAFGERAGNKTGTGCYGIIYLRFAFNVTIEIYDTPQRTIYGGTNYGRLTCAFPENAGPAYTVLHHNLTAHNPVDKEGIGGGFWNAVGFRFGSISGSEITRHLGSVESDSQANAVADLNAYLPTSNTAHICRFYFCDKVGNGSALANINVIPDIATGRSWSRNLTASDFNADGSLKKLVLASLYHRWYDQPNGDAKVSGLEITLDNFPINWLYYPWAIRDGDSWLSCNRDYNAHQSPERIAYLRIKEDGSWRDVLNNLQGSTPMDGLIKEGTWVRAALYGDNS